MRRSISATLCAALVFFFIGVTLYLRPVTNFSADYRIGEKDEANVLNPQNMAIGKSETAPEAVPVENEDSPHESKQNYPQETVNKPEPHEEALEFWGNVFEVFSKRKLDLSDEELASGFTYTHWSPQGALWQGTRWHLEDEANISPEFLHQLRVQHSHVLEEIPRTLPASTYVSDTSGIVLVGGGRYSWLSHLAILAIRDRGCELPVEVLIPTKNLYESDKDWCTGLLPQLNARCVVLPDELGPQVAASWGDQIEGYQYKALAILVLSFQHVLLLDSDNILLQDPTPLFDSELYRDYGMITWPDFWHRTVSPKFYDQLDIKVDETKRVRFKQFPLEPHTDDIPLLPQELAQVPFHDFAGAIPEKSTESGQMLVNKQSHGDALLLALYYNIHGPKVFYRLFSLGAPGEGDKETFVTAASVLKRPYYQVHSRIRSYGYTEEGKDFHCAAMRHVDPIEDYSTFLDKIVVPLKSKPPSQTEQINYIKSAHQKFFSEDSNMRSFGIHCNYPKLDPIMLREETIYDIEKNRLKLRMYDSFTLLEMKVRHDEFDTVYTDFELFMWKRISHMACGVEKVPFGYTRNVDLQLLCEFIGNQINWLQETYKRPELGPKVVRIY